LFTISLLGLITEHSVHVENPLYLKNYSFKVFEDLKTEKVPFFLISAPCALGACGRYVFVSVSVAKTGMFRFEFGVQK